MNFTSLGVKEELVKALTENNITEPTEVQKRVIPFLLERKEDLVGIAQTGTGKTAAYGLPILQNINANKKCIQALILVPTRELGQQVARNLFRFTKYYNRIFTEAVYGGKSIDEQMQRLSRGAHILVATPGRLIDLIEREAVQLNDLKYIVLDEADEMLNMGFQQDIDHILRYCEGEQTRMLFSATMPREIQAVVREFLHPNAFEIKIQKEEFVNKNISHLFMEYSDRKKLDYLKSFMLEHETEKGIVFCRTKAAVIKLGKQLAGFKVSCGVLHKDMNQEAREKVMRAIRKDRIQVLVATDIAARGIDINEVNYVLHYHLPERSEEYTHRSGRTARAGKTGNSLCMITPEEKDRLKQMEQKLKIRFKRIDLRIPEGSERTNIFNKYFINVGMMQGLTNFKLVEFIAKETAIQRNDIKNIYVEKQLSSFDMDKAYEDQLFANLKGRKVFKRNIKLSRSEKEAKSWSGGRKR